jgi:hypothetical protein
MPRVKPLAADRPPRKRRGAAPTETSLQFNAPALINEPGALFFEQEIKRGSSKMGKLHVATGRRVKVLASPLLQRRSIQTHSSREGPLT